MWPTKAFVTGWEPTEQEWNEILMKSYTKPIQELVCTTSALYVLKQGAQFEFWNYIYNRMDRGRAGIVGAVRNFVVRSLKRKLVNL